MKHFFMPLVGSCHTGNDIKFVSKVWADNLHFCEISMISSWSVDITLVSGGMNPYNFTKVPIYVPF